MHASEHQALATSTTIVAEKGSRLSCAIKILPWMNEMPVKAGFSVDAVLSEGQHVVSEDRRPWQERYY